MTSGREIPGQPGYRLPADGLSRFDQPLRRRDRLERAFTDLGLDLVDELAEPSPTTN
jgi:hypothetical protein